MLDALVGICNCGKHVAASVANSKTVVGSFATDEGFGGARHPRGDLSALVITTAWVASRQAVRGSGNMLVGPQLGFNTNLRGWKSS